MTTAQLMAELQVATNEYAAARLELERAQGVLDRTKGRLSSVWERVGKRLAASDAVSDEAKPEVKP